MNDFFGTLELQLRSAAERQPRRVPDLRGMPAVAIAVAMVALAMVPVLVLTGDDEPRPALRERPEGRLPDLPNQTVVASGVAPVAGPWRLVDYDSERLADPDTGEEYQPAGLPCLGISVREPGAASPGFSGQCGEFPRTPGFSRIQHTVRDTDGGAREILLYGRVPDEAAYVRVMPEGRSAIDVEPIEGPAGIPGDFYLVALSPDVARGRVNWFDSEGREGSRGIELLPP
jgi:hypothetical protein